MAEAREELILEIDVSNSVTKLAELRSSMDLLIQKRQTLTEKSISGDVAAGKELEKLNSTMRNTQMEYNAQKRILDGYSKSQKDGFDKTKLMTNSIDANVAALKQLTAQYKASANATPEMAKVVRDLSNAVNEQKLAIGDSTSNIGKYTQGFNRLTGSIVDIIPGLGGLKTAQLGVNAAMEANPIGLVVVAIQALTGVLSFFQPVMEAIERTTAGFTAGFGALVNGGNILEAAKQAAILKGQLQDLEEAQNGVNIANAETDRTIGRLLLRLRNKSLTESEAAKTLEDIAKADKERLDRNLAQEGAILKQKEENFKIINNLTQEEVNALVERGQLVNQLDDEELKRIQRLSKDSGIPLQKLIEEAKKSQLAVADIAEQKAKQKKEEFDAEIKAITDQRIKIIAIEEESELIGEKVATRKATIDDRFKAAREKADAEAERLQQKELDRLEKINIANEKALDKIRENAILQLEIQKQTGKTSEEIDLLFQESKLRDFKDFAAEQLRLQKEINERSKALQLENSNDEKALSTLRDNHSKQLELQKLFAESKLANLTESSEKTEAIKRLAAQSEEEIDKEFIASGLSSFAEFYRLKKQQYQDDATALKNSELEKQNAQKATIAAAETIAGGIINVIGRVAEAQGAGAEFAKAMALVQIGVSEAIAIANAVVAATSAGAETGIAAIGVIPAYLATFIGITLANIGQAIALLSTPVPSTPAKFAYGGGIDIDGKPHSGGGTPIHVNGRLVAEAEAGEKMFILKKSASEQIGLLSAFNQFFGGRSFTGSPVKHAADGGFIGDGGFAAREITRGVDNSLNAQIMENILSRLPTPQLSIVEFESKQSSRNRSVKVSEA